MNCQLCVHNEKKDPAIDYKSKCIYCLEHCQIIYEFVHKDIALEKFRKESHEDSRGNDGREGRPGQAQHEGRIR